MLLGAGGNVALFELDGSQAKVRIVSVLEPVVVLVNAQNALVPCYVLQLSGKVAVDAGSKSGAPLHRVGAVRWDPHHNCSLALVAVDSAIRAFDMRSMKYTYEHYEVLVVQ